MLLYSLYFIGFQEEEEFFTFFFSLFQPTFFFRLSCRSFRFLHWQVHRRGSSRARFLT